LAWIATVAVLGWAALFALPAFAQVDDDPSAISPSSSSMELYVRGPDSAIEQRVFGPAGWSENWLSLGRGLTSGPRAMVRDGSTIDVFARGPANTLYHRARANGVWSSWEDLGGGLLSAPGVGLRRGINYIDVAVRGGDNATWFRSWVPGVGWSDFSSLGGTTLGAPAVVSYKPQRVHVFVRSSDDAIWAISYDPVAAAWSAWSSLGGVATSAPSVVSDAEDHIDIFVRGSDAGTYRRSWTSAGWGPWVQIDPTPVSSGPGAVVLGEGRLAVFARRGSDIVMGTLTDSVWSGWAVVRATPPAPGIPQATACGHSIAKTTDSLRGKTRRTISYGNSTTLTGQALGPDRKPVPGAVVHVLDVRARKDLGQTVAGPDGKFRFKVPRGPSRTLRAGIQWPTEGIFACGGSLSLKVRAGVRLNASRRVRVRGRIQLSGRLLGGHIPPRGKVVELQGWARGGWQVFRTVRSSHKGRFRTTYRLRTGARQTLRIRARVRRERGYPFTLGYSRVVRVRIG
jgi:hypothetical protein